MKWFIVLIVMLVFAAAGVFFGQLNNQPLTVDLFFFSQELSTAVWLALAFLVGVVLAGALVYLNMWWVVRRRVRQTRKDEQAKASTALAKVENSLTASSSDP